MCATTPKYNIRARLLKMPGEWSPKVYQLCIDAGITEPTLRKIMNAEKTDDYSPSADTIILIAQFFECNVTDLVNN